MSTAKLIDIGANLTYHSLANNINCVIQRAKDNHLKKIVITGTSLKNSKDAIELAKQYPHFLYATVGIHPHDADKHICIKDISHQLENLAIQNLDVVKSLGECGLDFNRNFSTRENQIAMFEIQLKLAEKLKLPIFLHERDAHNDLVLCLKNTLSKDYLCHTVVHCYADGVKEHLEEYLDLGCYIGITGWITEAKRGKDLFEIVNIIPIERLMIETDSPFLKPRNIKDKELRKGRDNEPAYLKYVLRKVAESYSQLAQFQSLDIEEVEEILGNQTTLNAERFFNL
ncbi:hypothetical protein HK099_002480 [Clydaea vesicula]|uniref:Hydrolase TatD n=1 Tax=Clydaea vesicula TaxID=447962 RepID=A0AAD5XZ96_9FUNG|nr:hypothetical protein HK099_002480 [Clydaea vesicula]KAJ3388393.1 hypothetical protein HDU92_001527 [Lobulomyces angularis]